MSNPPLDQRQSDERWDNRGRNGGRSGERNDKKRGDERDIGASLSVGVDASPRPVPRPGGGQVADKRQPVGEDRKRRQPPQRPAVQRNKGNRRQRNRQYRPLI